MKKARQGLLLLLMVVVALLFAACDITDKGRTDTGTDEEVSIVQEDSAAEESGAGDIADEEEVDVDEPVEEEPVSDEPDEESDPANADPTNGTVDGTDDEVQRRYIGTWTLLGIEYWEGSIEEAGKCTIEILREGNYTMKGKLSGKKVNRKGSWSINEKKKLVLDDDTLGINEEGYLLMYTGERDGKGKKLYYAFQRN